MAATSRDSDMLVLPPALENPTSAMARAILQMKIGPRVQRRMTRLLQANQRGALSREQYDELMSYVQFANFLTLLHSKARLALKRSSARPRRKSA